MGGLHAEPTGARLPALASLVLAEQVRGLYASAALPFLTVVVNASVLGYVLWTPASSTPIAAWLGALYAITSARVVLWRLYVRRSPAADQSARWGWAFASGSAANGVAWGASAVVLYPPGDVVLQAILLLVLGGMTAGAAASTATFFPAFVAFSLPAMAPIACRLVAEGDKVHLALGGMAALFTFAMTQIARTGGRRLVTSEELRFNNAALLEDLGRTQARLTASNEDLERRVVERTGELVAARDKLAVTERMASLGTLAAGVAHEINNPLAFLLSNLEYVQGTLRSAIDDLARDGTAPKTESRLREATDAMTDACVGAGRVRDIVRDLGMFSRGADDRAETIDVVATLETAIRMAANELRHRARLEREFSEVPNVVGHPGRLGQVFLNLLVNAAQAIPEGKASKNIVRVVTKTDDEGRAVVEIHDTGSGIPADALPRIFDPFFTTKPVGEGTGLGLSICHGIVRAMGGDVEVESEEGRGSVFRVVVPPGQVAATPPPPVATPPRRRARILLIDDEPLLGEGIARALGGEHEVVVETQASRALRRITEGERFDAIVCDLMMPDCSGMEFYDRLKLADPTLVSRIVFTTGGAFTTPAQEFLDRIPNERVHKPFAAGQLEAALGAVLSR